jgi:hypothetical protein
MAIKWSVSRKLTWPGMVYGVRFLGLAPWRTAVFALALTMEKVS